MNNDTGIVTGPFDEEIRTRLDALVRRQREASGMGMHLITMVGGQAEGLLNRLPSEVRNRLEQATARALEIAFAAASYSRGQLSDQPSLVNRAVTTAMGAAGGMGGIPTALAELPVTATYLLRTIQGVAMEYGFDPSDEAVRMDCLQVFAAAGPLERDDGTDVAFLTTRMALTGASLRGLAARVAPRLSIVLGQKLSAQAVPVLGAVAGAATNWTFTRYYHEMAHVYFGLRALARDKGFDHATLVAEFRTRMTSITDAR